MYIQIYYCLKSDKAKLFARITYAGASVIERLCVWSVISIFFFVVVVVEAHAGAKKNKINGKEGEKKENYISRNSFSNDADNFSWKIIVFLGFQ